MDAMTTPATAGRKFEELVRILGTLRAPGGCPWDRAQGARAIRDYFLEEVFEAVEALESGSPEELAEELGDVLMEVVLLSAIFEEKGKFSVADALDRINAKMIARHPHVFEKRRTIGAKGVAGAWQERKLAEKNRTSILQDPGASTPALLAAFIVSRRVAGVGFDWPDARQAMDKVREETAELEEAVSRGKKRHVREEIGDLFFSLVNVSRKLGINPEVALRAANRKFVGRFRALESEVRRSGRKMGKIGLAEMDEIWDGLKKKRR